MNSKARGPNQESHIFCICTFFFRPSAMFAIIPCTYLWTGPGRATVGIVPLTDRAKGGGMLPLVTIRPKYTARWDPGLEKKIKEDCVFRTGSSAVVTDVLIRKLKVMVVLPRTQNLDYLDCNPRTAMIVLVTLFTSPPIFCYCCCCCSAQGHLTVWWRQAWFWRRGEGGGWGGGAGCVLSSLTQLSASN